MFSVYHEERTFAKIDVFNIFIFNSYPTLYTVSKNIKKCTFSQMSPSIYLKPRFAKKIQRQKNTQKKAITLQINTLAVLRIFANVFRQFLSLRPIFCSREKRIFLQVVQVQNLQVLLSALKFLFPCSGKDNQGNRDS